MVVLKLTGPVVGNDAGWVYDFLGIDCITPKVVTDVLNESPDELEINLSSGGGEVTAASEIYTALRQSNTNVIINITGIAASAASVIAMAGDTVNISPTAQLMIHQASFMGLSGNKNDLSHAAEILDTTDKSIAHAYVDKTGLPIDQVIKMMADETFLSAQDATKYGFADTIMFADKVKQVNSLEAPLISSDAINKIGTLLMTNKGMDSKLEENKTMQSRQALKNAKAAILLEENNDGKY